ncbi:MAG: hypothetical protein ACPL7M_05545, partial [Bryobacteraceae bacterium]
MQRQQGAPFGNGGLEKALAAVASRFEFEVKRPRDGIGRRPVPSKSGMMVGQRARWMRDAAWPLWSSAASLRLAQITRRVVT